jgi:hypothetical protein
MPFVTMARKKLPQKKVGGIFFGERECERAMVGRKPEQVPWTARDGLKVGKGRGARCGWLEEAGCEAGDAAGTCRSRIIDFPGGEGEGRAFARKSACMSVRFGRSEARWYL